MLPERNTAHLLHANITMRSGYRTEVAEALPLAFLLPFVMFKAAQQLAQFGHDGQQVISPERRLLGDIASATGQLQTPHKLSYE